MNSIWKFALRHSFIIIFVTDKGAIQRANERVIIILTEKSTIWLMGGKDLIQCQIIFVQIFHLFVAGLESELSLV